MRACLIAIDIDGTLLGSNGRVSERNRAALLRAEREGVEIVIATGRRHSYAMRVLRDLGLRGTGALISSNGTVIRTMEAKLISRRPMPLDTARWLCREVEDFRDTFVLTFDNVGEDGEDRHGALVCETTDALHASVGGWMRANEPYVARVERMEHALAPATRKNRGGSAAVGFADDGIDGITGMEGIDGIVGIEGIDGIDGAESPKNALIQAMLCGSVARMAAAEARLMQHPAIAGVGEPELSGCEIVLQRTAYPDRDLVILDILPAGCSKASALADLSAMRGCILADVIAIGDNWNDLPMLEAAGKAVLMGNAPQELRALASQRGWTIGPTNDEDGVALAIEAALGQAG